MAETSIPVIATIPPISQPVFDRQTGLMTDPWYRFLESMRNRTGGDVDLVDGTKVAASVADDKAVSADEKAVAAQEDLDGLKENEVEAGIGLEGGGQIGGGIRIDALQQVGWVQSTGAGDYTTPYAQYTAGTANAAYVQADFQAVMDALAALSARYVALEAAMFLNEGLAPPPSP